MQTATARLFARESAAHLYLLDYNAGELQPFAERLATEFPATKVSLANTSRPGRRD